MPLSAIKHLKKKAKRIIFKSFELGFQTTDKEEALQWESVGFRVRVYNGNEYIGELKQDGILYACLGEV